MVPAASCSPLCWWLLLPAWWVLAWTSTLYEKYTYDMHIKTPNNAAKKKETAPAMATKESTKELIVELKKSLRRILQRNAMIDECLLLDLSVSLTFFNRLPEHSSLYHGHTQIILPRKFQAQTYTISRLFQPKSFERLDTKWHCRHANLCCICTDQRVRISPTTKCAECDRTSRSSPSTGPVHMLSPYLNLMSKDFGRLGGT